MISEFVCQECGAVLGVEEIDFEYCGCCGGAGLGDEDDGAFDEDEGEDRS